MKTLTQLHEESSIILTIVNLKDNSVTEILKTSIICSRVHKRNGDTEVIQYSLINGGLLSFEKEDHIFN